ncbi:hypothetical protein [Deinococcus rubellus]|uniref:hypothetical protein n=1 Tax=Deinococcus rubellus TaxID=1889240 RepID=UPI0031EBADDC
MEHRPILPLLCLLPLLSTRQSTRTTPINFDTDSQILRGHWTRTITLGDGQTKDLILEHRLAGAASLSARAIHDMRPVAAYAGSLRQQGLRSRVMASQLEAHGFKTRKGGPWNAVQVKRVLDRQNPGILNSVDEFDNG